MAALAYAPARGVQELSLEEIDAVSGGPAPLVGIAAGMAVRFVVARVMGHSAKVAAQRSVAGTLVSQTGPSTPQN